MYFHYRVLVCFFIYYLFIYFICELVGILTHTFKYTYILSILSILFFFVLNHLTSPSLSMCNVFVILLVQIINQCKEVETLQHTVDKIS